MSVVIVVAVVSGCAQDVAAHFPAPKDEPTGSIVLLLSDAAQGVSVAVNGLLVVDSAHTQRIVIDHVPIGSAEVVMTANGGDKSFKVWVGSEHPTTVPLGAPSVGPGIVSTMLGAVITVLGYALLR